MTLSTYATIGTVFFWIGLLVTVVSVVIILFAIPGIPIALPGDEPSHDTIKLVLSGSSWALMVAPLVAGLILVGFGWFFKIQMLSVVDQFTQDQATMENPLGASEDPGLSR